MTTSRAAVYVDGFNLYYRALKNTKLKWLDLQKLSLQVLGPGHKLVAIKYFTADVSGKIDPGAQQRQAIYLRALKTIPNLSVHKGRFLAKKKQAKRANAPGFVEVLQMEEKGSDVNLATHLVADGFRGVYDIGVVVSNDTDLVEPIRLVTQELGKTVGLFCPAKYPSKPLKDVASFVRELRPGRLRKAQFPDRIPGTSLRRPSSWK